MIDFIIQAFASGAARPQITHQQQLSPAGVFGGTCRAPDSIVIRGSTEVGDEERNTRWLDEPSKKDMETWFEWHKRRMSVGPLSPKAVAERFERCRPPKDARLSRLEEARRLQAERRKAG